MVIGDGDHSAPPAEPGGMDRSAPAAALCYDSDDLLTSRRGMVAIRAEQQPATNGHTVASVLVEAPEVSVSQPTDAPSNEVPAAGAPPAVAAAPADDVAPAIDQRHETSVSSPTDVAPEALPERDTAAVEVMPAPAADSEALSPERVLAPIASPGASDGAHNDAGQPDALLTTRMPGDAVSELEAEPPMADVAALLETDIGVEHAGDEPHDVAALTSAPPMSDLPIALAEAEYAPAPLSAGNGHVQDQGDLPPVELSDSTAARVDDVTAPPATSGDDFLLRTNGIGLHAAITAEYVPLGEAEPAALSEAPAPDDAEQMADEEAREPQPASVADAWNSATAEETPSISTLERAPTADPSEQVLAGPIVLGDPGMPVIPPPEPPAPPLAAAPPPPPAAPPPDDEEDGASMTIIEHLEELRRRLTRSAISVVVGAVLGWFITPHVVAYLENSARKLGSSFYSPNILGPFALELKLSFLIGVILASPVVLYQIWAFVAPGLTRQERRYALPFSLIGGGLFAVGAVVGVLVVPLAIRFLTGFFAVLNLEQLLDIDRYIMFIAIIAVIFGITFELPIFMVGFSLLGVVSSRFFIEKFKISIFVIYGAAMLITPGADLVSPLVLGTFLIALYWLGVLLIRILGR